ncbi:Wzz/FepE/Etk N-terminal domain-containing protein [Dactylosporangium sp. NPDC049140]|jgi:capsular polysaccharide biosynthesis protein|uniref:Wzz/FepE/Etk N-terminal domain-containing protein n=1 Tax=Dactylosporangium sp. NPDC049140 TaxID=3155647 RepID=UPI0034043CAF
MDLGEILRVLRQRWLLVVPMFVLAIGAGVAAMVYVPNTYESYTTVSLLSSPMATTVATKGNDNPFMTFDASLIATADFLGRSLQSTDAVEELKDRGVTEKYAVSLADGAQGPFLTFTVTGSDKAHVRASTSTLAKFAQEKLTEIQQNNGVKTQDMIRMTEIVPPQTPETKSKKKIEVVLAATGGMIALTLMVTFVLESMSRNKARRTAGDRKPGSSAPADTAPPVAASATASVAAVTPLPRPNPISVTWSDVPFDQTVVLDMDSKRASADGADRPGETDQTVVIKMPVKPGGSDSRGRGDTGSAKGRWGSAR